MTDRARDLGGYSQVLRRRKWQIVFVVLVIAGAVAAATAFMTPVYDAHATVLVKGVPSPGSSGTVLTPPDLPTEQGLILQSNDIVSRVQSSLGTTETTQQLLDHLHVSVLPQTSLITVGYSDPDPQRAADLANAFADAYVSFHGQQATSQFQAAAQVVQQQINAAQTRIDQLRSKLQSTPDRATRAQLQDQSGVLYAQLGVLNQRLIDLTSTEGIAQTSAFVVERAVPPSDPSAPSYPRNIAAALVGGIAIALAVAFLRDRFDDRIDTPEALADILEAPVLAVIPRWRKWRNSRRTPLVTRVDPTSEVSEAYGTLTTSVLHVASRRHLRVVTVTSAVRGEGKTTTSANLGVALAESGRRVTLVSADLRHPRLHDFFDLKNGSGFSDLQIGAPTDPIVETGIPNLRLVNAGHATTNPVGLLSSGSVRDLIESLRDVSDLVIIDTPPVLGVADVLVLAQVSDGTILVASERSSKTSNIERAHDQLLTTGAEIVGGVYNNADPKRNTVGPTARSGFQGANRARRAPSDGDGHAASYGRARTTDERP